MSIDVDWTEQASNKYLQNKNRPTAREFKLEEHEVEKSNWLKPNWAQEKYKPWFVGNKMQPEYIGALE